MSTMLVYTHKKQPLCTRCGGGSRTISVSVSIHDKKIKIIIDMYGCSGFAENKEHTINLEWTGLWIKKIKCINYIHDISTDMVDSILKYIDSLEFRQDKTTLYNSI
jgi:hypothetical protein